MSSRAAALCFVAFIACCQWSEANAQAAPGAPAAVGVVRAERQQITQTDEFIGRIQAMNRVALVARVTGFMEKRMFVEGSEVKQGDMLYLLEQPPFEAQVDAAKATIEQLRAQHRNAELTLNRAQELLKTQAGPQTTVDSALSAERALAAQIDGAQAQLKTAEINLDYTSIRAPIDGRITSTAVTEGNVVSPSTGTLATIVSQDPMYVVFTVSSRTRLDLRNRYANKGGYAAVVIKLRLPDGRIFEPDGKLDYISPTVTETTDTLMFRGVIANPESPAMKAGQIGVRELADGEFVTVLLEGVQHVTVLGVPRAAVLSDQEGDYVYVVDAQTKAQVRRIQLGQSTPSTAVITSGLTEGELVISEGVRRVRSGEAVSAGPATPAPSIAPGAPSRPASGTPPPDVSPQPSVAAPGAKQ
jgi:membrane fusion protein, multidrug efflux system